MRLALLVLLALPVAARDDRVYGWSLAALGASQVVDVHSSLGHYEANPVVGAGPCCTPKQVGTKVAIVVGAQAAGWWFTRRSPAARRWLGYVNFGAAAATGAIAARNYRLPGP